MSTRSLSVLIATNAVDHQALDGQDVMPAEDTEQDAELVLGSDSKTAEDGKPPQQS